MNGVGAKKFGMSFETQGNQTFWRDIPGFCPGYPEGARKSGEQKTNKHKQLRGTVPEMGGGHFVYVFP